VYISDKDISNISKLASEKLVVTVYKAASFTNTELVVPSYILFDNRKTE